MGDSVIFMGWNRPVPGREALNAEHFQESMQYLGRLQAEGMIESFQTVLLNPHGGDLNGFVLIRGEASKLQDLSATEEWLANTTRSGVLLEGFGVVGGVTGDLLMEWMGRWSSLIPT